MGEISELLDGKYGYKISVLDGNGNGLGIGMMSLEWDGIGTKYLFPHISTLRLFHLLPNSLNANYRSGPPVLLLQLRRKAIAELLVLLQYHFLVVSCES